MKKPIGIFDSGFGGLTVLSRVAKLLPNEDIIYFGDTAHVPYGSKSKEVVTIFSVAIAKFLSEKKVKLIVVACNTASAFALSHLQKKFKVPVLGVIFPGAKDALKSSKRKRIAVIGTEGTIKSSSYTKAIISLNNQAVVYAKACPLFVPLVEEGWINHSVTKEVAKEYLTPLVNKGIDTLVLGCTHYPLIKKVIKNVISRNITLIDSAEATAKDVLNILKKLKLQEKGKSAGRHSFYVSDSPEKFKFYAKRFLGYNINNVKKITLD